MGVRECWFTSRIPLGETKNLLPSFFFKDRRLSRVNRMEDTQETVYRERRK